MSLFETRNVWTFIKLDTRNGKMTQVHYALDSESYQGEVELNTKSLIKGEGKPGALLCIPLRTCLTSSCWIRLAVVLTKFNGQLKEDTTYGRPYLGK